MLSMKQFDLHVFFPQGLFPHRTSPCHMWPLTLRWSPGAATREMSQMALWSTWPEGWIPGVVSCPMGNWDYIPCVNWRQDSTTMWLSHPSKTQGRNRSTAYLNTWPSLPVSPCVWEKWFLITLSFTWTHAIWCACFQGTIQYHTCTAFYHGRLLKKLCLMCWQCCCHAQLCS